MVVHLPPPSRPPPQWQQESRRPRCFGMGGMKRERLSGWVGGWVDDKSSSFQPPSCPLSKEDTDSPTYLPRSRESALASSSGFEESGPVDVNLFRLHHQGRLAAGRSNQGLTEVVLVALFWEEVGGWVGGWVGGLGRGEGGGDLNEVLDCMGGWVGGWVGGWLRRRWFERATVMHR